MNQSECKSVPHPLLGEVEPDSSFTVTDICSGALSGVKKTVTADRDPNIVGGSNLFIEELVEDKLSNFKSKYEYESCVLPISVSSADHTVKAGLIELDQTAQKQSWLDHGQDRRYQCVRKIRRKGCFRMGESSVAAKFRDSHR